MVRVKPYSPEKHYAAMVEWWLHHNWQPVAKEVLPVGSGWVVEVEGVPTCAGFFYTVQEVPQVAWMEWVVSNPSVSKEARSEALDALIGHITKVAESKGVKILFSAASHPGYLARLSKLGFTSGDTGMTHMVKTWQQ